MKYCVLLRMIVVGLYSAYNVSSTFSNIDKALIKNNQKGGHRTVWIGTGKLLRSCIFIHHKKLVCKKNLSDPFDALYVF